MTGLAYRTELPESGVRARRGPAVALSPPLRNSDGSRSTPFRPPDWVLLILKKDMRYSTRDHVIFHQTRVE